MSEEEKKENELSVLPVHYRQIDFLRLFRFCKNLGFVERKRKMPADYIIGREYDDKSARSACRRLLRIVVVKTFSEDFHVRSDYNNYSIDLSRAQRIIFEDFYRVSANRNHIFDPYHQAYNDLCSEYDRDFIYLSLPYRIRVSFTSSVGGRYAVKPHENFYKAAVACVRYKRIWDENFPKLSEGISALKEYEERLNLEHAEREKKTKEALLRLREAVNNSRQRMTEREDEEIDQPTEHQQSSTSQAAFDVALQNLLERRSREQ